MEIKAKLKYPYTETDKLNFIVFYNHQNGYVIKYADREGIKLIVPDIEAWGYTDEELLFFAKQSKNEENIAKAKEAIEEGYVEFKDAQFETNSQTVGDLTAVKELIQETGMETYTWLSRDDKSVVLTLADFRTLGVLIAQYKNNVWNVKYLDFKQQIALAETLEEVEAIIIDYNVPMENIDEEESNIIDTNDNNFNEGSENE